MNYSPRRNLFRRGQKKQARGAWLVATAPKQKIPSYLKQKKPTATRMVGSDRMVKKALLSIAIDDAVRRMLDASERSR